MNEIGSERSKSWNIYTTSDQSQSQTDIGQEAPWKNFGSSMNAISFGFVATAILISMFLIMAIFEHLFRPASHSARPARTAKFIAPNTVQTSYASDFSVLMPGQHCPTFIAQPAPLPCPREGVYWPSHYHKFSNHKFSGQ